MKQKDEATLQLEALERITKLNTAEICALFDTGAFNTICCGYIKYLSANGKNSAKASELREAFDSMTASEALNYYMNS